MAILTQSKARPGWWAILTNFWAELDRDHVSIMAAGVAFYALLSIFPGMSALISLYGLVADPVAIENQLSSLSGVLPEEALKLLSDQLHALVAAPRDKLGLGLLVSLLLALWSATSGTGALMQALTIAYEERDERGILSFYGLAIALTIGVGLFALSSLFLLAVLALIAFAALYRYAPSRRQPCWFPQRWHDRGSTVVADRLGRFLVLRRAIQLLRQDVWLDRRGRHPADVVLCDGVHHPRRRRAEFGNREGAGTQLSAARSRQFPAAANGRSRNTGDNRNSG